VSHWIHSLGGQCVPPTRPSAWSLRERRLSRAYTSLVQAQNDPSKAAVTFRPRRSAQVDHPRVVLRSSRRRPPGAQRAVGGSPAPSADLPALYAPAGQSRRRERTRVPLPVTLRAAQRQIRQLQRDLAAARADTAELRLRHARLSVRFYSLEAVRQGEAIPPPAQPWYRRFWLAIVGKDVRTGDWPAVERIP
jgi:hypothetical protein